MQLEYVQCGKCYEVWTTIAWAVDNCCPDCGALHNRPT